MERVSPAPCVVVCDEAAEAMSLEDAFRRYASYVAAVAMRLLGRDDEIDDVVQEVFLEAARGLGQLRAPGAIKGWLATVAVRAAGRRLKRRRLRGWLGLDRCPDYEQIACKEARPDERALIARIYAELDRMPVGERLAWSLRHVEGEQLDVVARLCGCSVATAKRRITAAQLRLQRVFDD
jgi:RNA polymerase sigma-70 factor, ECF subfamily